MLYFSKKKLKQFCFHASYFWFMNMQIRFKYHLAHVSPTVNNGYASVTFINKRLQLHILNVHKWTKLALNKEDEWRAFKDLLICRVANRKTISLCFEAYFILNLGKDSPGALRKLFSEIHLFSRFYSIALNWLPIVTKQTIRSSFSRFVWKVYASNLGNLFWWMREADSVKVWRCYTCRGWRILIISSPL